MAHEHNKLLFASFPWIGLDTTLHYITLEGKEEHPGVCLRSDLWMLIAMDIGDDETIMNCEPN